MKPERIIIVRHGQSAGNADKTIYQAVPDYALPLTEIGKAQALAAGLAIQRLLATSHAYDPAQHVQFYVSPFWRARQTYEGISQPFPNHTKREDPRLREQEWGHLRNANATKELETLRDAYGRYFYRLQDGESGADVEDRITTFLDTVHRDFEKRNFPTNVIMVTHGFTARIILKRWFHLTTEQFEKMANPPNCGFFSLRLEHHLHSVYDGKYVLEIGPKDEPIPAPWIYSQTN